MALIQDTSTAPTGAASAPLLENSYGNVKRLEFVAEAIRRYRPARVLDMGCGTGAHLTALLAERFSYVQFVGVDSDEGSIAYATRESRLQNATWIATNDIHALGRFHLVIASEVIEHVEDPAGFLLSLRESLADDAKLLLTLPNGYGPSEFASLLETLLHQWGIRPFVVSLGRRLRCAPRVSAIPDTLAASPHVSFFSYAEIMGLLGDCGFRVLEYRPRTILCGFGFDQLLAGETPLRWNACIADRLPPAFSSDWMFLLEPTSGGRRASYRTSLWTRFRRSLNERRRRCAQESSHD